jgi:hypothetical protein
MVKERESALPTLTSDYCMRFLGMLGAFFAKNWVTVTSRRVMSMCMRDKIYAALISAFQPHVFEHFSPVLTTQYKSSYFIYMQPQHPENYTCRVTEACVLVSSRTVATIFNKLDPPRVRNFVTLIAMEMHNSFQKQDSIHRDAI